MLSLWFRWWISSSNSMGENNKEETGGMEWTAFWVMTDLVHDPSPDCNSPGPSTSSLFTLLPGTSSCFSCPASQLEYWRGRSCKTATVSLWGQNWLKMGKLKVYFARTRKHTCLVFRTQWSFGELICSAIPLLLSCILGRERAKWSHGRGTSEPIKTSQKATGIFEWNLHCERIFAPCSSQRSTAQWSNIAEERLLQATQFVTLKLVQNSFCKGYLNPSCASFETSWQSALAVDFASLESLQPWQQK